MPEGATAGETITFEAPGEEFEIALPTEAQAGQQIKVTVPSATVAGEFEELEVTVTEEAVAGGKLSFEAPGEVFETVVPDGHAAGDEMKVSVPTGPPPPAPKVAVTEEDIAAGHISVQDASGETVKVPVPTGAAAGQHIEVPSAATGTGESTIVAVTEDDIKAGHVSVVDSTGQKVKKALPPGTSAGQRVTVASEPFGGGSTFEPFGESEAGGTVAPAPAGPPPEPATYALTVPAGMSAGEQMEIHTADGKAVVVNVPANNKAGETFYVQVSSEVLAAAPDITEVAPSKPKKRRKRVQKPPPRKGTNDHAHAVLVGKMDTSHAAYEEAHQLIKMGFHSAAAMECALASIEQKAKLETTPDHELEDIAHGIHSSICSALGTSKHYEERAKSVASSSRPSTVGDRAGSRGDPFPAGAGGALGGAHTINPALGEAYARDINGGSPDSQIGRAAGNAVIADPALATGTSSYRGASRERRPPPRPKQQKNEYDEDLNPDWSVQGSRGKKRAPPPDHDADWALPRLVAPKGSAFGQRPLGGGARRPAPPSGVPTHIAGKQGPGMAGARVQGGDAVFGVLAVKRAATAPNWVAGRHGASATVGATPRTGNARMIPHASWEAIVGPVAEWADDNVITDYIEERNKEPMGRRISTSESIRRGQLPKTPMSTSSRLSSQQRATSPRASSRGRSPRAGDRGLAGDRNSRITPRSAMSQQTHAGSNVIRPRTTPAGVGRRNDPLDLIAGPPGYMTDRPKTSGGPTASVAAVDLRLPLTDRGPMAQRARQARLSGVMGGSWNRGGITSPRANELYRTIDSTQRGGGTANSWTPGGDSARLDQGGELIAKPPRHGDMDKPPPGLWGHDAIPGGANGNQPVVDLASSITRAGAAAAEWENLTRDYDQEFPSDPAGWHFGHAFQDLQAIQHKHMLTAPAAGPGFFYSTARTAVTPGAANPTAFQEEIRPSTAPYVPPGAEERPTTAPIAAATAAAAAVISGGSRGGAGGAGAGGGGGGNWALDEDDTSHHFLYEASSGKPEGGGPRTPSPPERQPSPPDPELAVGSQLYQRSARGTAPPRATRPTSVRLLHKPSVAASQRGRRTAARTTAITPVAAAAAAPTGATTGTGAAAGSLASPTMTVGMMEKRLQAGVAPALQRRVVS